MRALVPTVLATLGAMLITPHSPDDALILARRAAIQI
jgi:hypothetical protein